MALQFILYAHQHSDDSVFSKRVAVTFICEYFQYSPTNVNKLINILFLRIARVRLVAPFSFALRGS